MTKDGLVWKAQAPSSVLRQITILFLDRPLIVTYIGIKKSCPFSLFLPS